MCHCATPRPAPAGRRGSDQTGRTGGHYSGYFIRSGFVSDSFKPQSFDPIGVNQEVHRDGAKSAKGKGNE